MSNDIKQPVAVIDIGSHSIRMEIAQFDLKGNKELLNQLDDSIYLGADVFTKGKITSKNIRHACKILSDCAKLMKEYDITKYQAIATSAVREADNQDIFINRIKIESNIDVKILEPAEEIKLNYLAVKDAISKRFGLQKHNAIICNIGTGSTQLAFIENGNFKATQTLNFGTLRLIEEIFSNVSSRKLHETIDPFIENVVDGVIRMAPKNRSDLFVVVGATPRALVNIDRKQAPKIIATVSRKQFEKLSAEISGLKPSELIEKYHLSDSIALGLEPCCNLLEHFFDITNADRLVIPLINTREVIMRDILREESGKPDAFAKEIISATQFIGEKHNYDAIHSASVSKYAVELFDKLKNIHKLGYKARTILELAGYLHDVGQFISTRKHHKHSMYIVENSLIPGLSEQNRKILALLCRYHRKSPPKTSHMDYVNLRTDERVLVCKLAAILRVADALDRSHQNRIKIKRLSFEDDQTMTIHITSKANDITLEQWAVKKKCDMFTDTFGLKVKVVEDEK